MVMNTYKTPAGKRMQVVTEIGRAVRASGRKPGSPPRQDKEAHVTEGIEPITDAELISRLVVISNSNDTPAGTLAEQSSRDTWFQNREIWTQCRAQAADQPHHV